MCLINGYAPTDAGYAVDQYVNFAMGGDGQLFTSVGDLLKWHDYLYGNAGDKVGVPSITDLMLTPGSLASGDTLDYAFGLFLEDFRGLKEIQHHGSWGGFRTYLTRFPEASTSIAVLCNRADASPWAAGHKMATMMLADQMATANETTEASVTSKNDLVVDTALLESYTGRYEVGQLAIIYTIARDGNNLTLKQDDDPVSLQTVNDSTFVSQSAGLRFNFHRDASGQVERATLTADSDSLLRTSFNAGAKSNLRRLLPWSPSAEHLAAYVGRYYSPQLEAAYMIQVKGNGLLLKHPRRDDTWIEPKESHVFTGDYPFMSVRFEKNENNRVMGFHVLAGGTQAVRFEKQALKE